MIFKQCWLNFIKTNWLLIIICRIISIPLRIGCGCKVWYPSRTIWWSAQFPLKQVQHTV